jgi:hypothetical protein
MGWFKRRFELIEAMGEGRAGPAEAAPPEPEPSPAEPPDPPGDEIRVCRTLVKSEPELAALVASEPTLAADGVSVSLSEKGFGTKVAITARSPSELGEADLEHLLDELAEPQKRPFTNT